MQNHNTRMLPTNLPNIAMKTVVIANVVNAHGTTVNLRPWHFLESIGPHFGIVLERRIPAILIPPRTGREWEGCAAYNQRCPISPVVMGRTSLSACHESFHHCSPRDFEVLVPRSSGLAQFGCQMLVLPQGVHSQGEGLWTGIRDQPCLPIAHKL